MGDDAEAEAAAFAEAKAKVLAFTTDPATTTTLARSPRPRARRWWWPTRRPPGWRTLKGVAGNGTKSVGDDGLSNKGPSKDLHVTLFSLHRLGRGEKPVGQAALERVRAVWRGGTFGTATGIVLKVKGARYDDEDECRVLAAA